MISELPTVPHLTPSEFVILRALRSQAGNAVSVAGLDEALYGDTPKFPPKGFPGFVKVLLHRLRKKLAGTPYRIKNVRGRGYRLAEVA